MFAAPLLTRKKEKINYITIIRKEAFKNLNIDVECLLFLNNSDVPLEFRVQINNFSSLKGWCDFVQDPVGGAPPTGS